MRTLIAYVLAFTVRLRETAEAVNTATTAEELSHKIKNTKERINK